MEDNLNNNINEITPYQASDITRLQNNQELDGQITMEEIKSTIKSIKTNTFGESNINKIILKN